ncbi:MAG: PilZ domain-containing protein [Anaerolineae bacterium]|nr:PilZ domain-containing protein [Anaerolineae bacterium]
MAQFDVAENRQDERFIVQDLAVFDGALKKFVGKAIDLSLSGMLISLEKALAVGSVINISLGHMLNNYSDLDVETQVVWFRQNDISGLFSIGLKFLNNTEEQRSQIQKVINTYAVYGV